MARTQQSPSSAIIRVASVVSLFVLLVIATAAQAQTFVSLHDFRGPEGLGPMAGLTMDREGNFYGTAAGGGNAAPTCIYNGGCGTVFKLTLKNSSWILTPLYWFSGPDGWAPTSRVIFGPDGSLYGTTEYGGTANQGTVYKLSPPANACKTAICPWHETVLYSFQGSPDGAQPQLGDLVFDRQGNIYGTTPYGGLTGCDGAGNCGVVYELTPSNGGGSESVLYSFRGGNDGGGPYAGMIFDSAGNLYGVASFGGTEYAGAVFELTPSQSGWTESVIYSMDFLTTGQFPLGGLIADAAGNLYGTTSESGTGTGGTVYELTASNGSWTATVLYGLSGYTGSFAFPAMDAAGNIYGTMYSGDNEVFKISRSGGSWIQTGFSEYDGGYPSSNVVLDSSSNVYGTAFAGGAYDKGVIFEIVQ